MHYWSEGLGRRQLIINLEKSRLDNKGEFLELSGVVDAPAPWEYEIEVEFDDWKAILETAVKRDTGTFLVQRASGGQLLAIIGGLLRFMLMLALYRGLHLLGPGAARWTAAPEVSADADAPVVSKGQ